jgi:hypothetical protein
MNGAAAGRTGSSTGPGRETTPESAILARDAILFELCAWEHLDAEAPRLAGVRDRLTRQPGRRII